MKRIFGLLAVLLVLAIPASAQVPTPNTPVQQVGMHSEQLRCDSATGVGATGTLTLLNPGPGLADYIVSLTVTLEATGVVSAAAPIAITSTNINGTSPTFGSIGLIASTQGAVLGPGPIPLGTGIKANTNTAPTFVVGTVANGTSRLTACYYVAP